MADINSSSAIGSVPPEATLIDKTSTAAVDSRQKTAIKNSEIARTESFTSVEKAEENSALQRLTNVKLAITIDESADLPVIKIYDNDTGDQIMQVPAEHSLNISKTIKAAVGAIFDKTV
jgi:uncharacterized FlaG/YvyC family protein